MKKLALFISILGLTTLFSACSDPIEKDAEQLADLACEGGRTTDLDRKREIIKQYIELKKEIKAKYKKRDAEALRVADLYFKKVTDCLGYVPFRWE